MEPCYSRVKWEEDAIRKEKILQGMCEFPLLSKQGSKAHFGGDDLQNTDSMQYGDSDIIFPQTMDSRRSR